MKETTAPVFSLSALRNGFHRAELRRCLTETGAFYLTDYGISEGQHQFSREAIMRFFEKSDEDEKQSVTNKISNIRRGYSQLGSESTAQITNAGQYTDYSVNYSMGLSRNLFPSSEFEDAVTPYFQSFYRAAQEVAREVLNTIEADCEGGIDSFLECDPMWRFRYFPEVPEHRSAEHEPLRMASHYDLSIITLIHQTPCPNGFVSLQYELNASYVNLQPLPNSVIVFCGAVLALASNGETKAPKHRVRAPSSSQRIGSSRTSSVFFLRPRPNFAFPIALAKACGFDINLTGETATFQDWISGNYVSLHTRDSKAMKLT